MPRRGKVSPIHFADTQMFNLISLLFQPKLSEICTQKWFERQFKSVDTLRTVERELAKVAHCRGLIPNGQEIAVVVYSKLVEFSKRHLGAFASEGIKAELKRMGLPTTLREDLKVYFEGMTPKATRIYLDMFGGRQGFARALSHQNFCECLKTAPNGKPLKIAHFGAYTEQAIEEALTELGIA